MMKPYCVVPTKLYCVTATKPYCACHDETILPVAMTKPYLRQVPMKPLCRQRRRPCVAMIETIPASPAMTEPCYFRVAASKPHCVAMTKPIPVSPMKPYCVVMTVHTRVAHDETIPVADDNEYHSLQYGFVMATQYGFVMATQYGFVMATQHSAGTHRIRRGL
ncbi:hypothetical protein AVEN_105825-1 [Araneus ventricosus]|uniref:Uncharacterized protein n=1 Tax=Araneus ventricosus TaxID=182803 RepID=A0A4Y2VVE0_ARAVE|nr:hypothetical protein AVEN_105825-1 [Araneus ventricosus]